MGTRLLGRQSVRRHLRLLSLPFAILVTKGCCVTFDANDSSQEGCSSGYYPYGDARGGTGGWSGTGGHSTGGHATGGSGGSGIPNDAGPPEDWHEYSQWYDCPFLVAPEGGIPGLGWHACGSIAPAGHGCSRLGSSFDEIPGTLVPVAAMSRDPATSLPLIHLLYEQVRASGTWRFSLVTEDGGGLIRHAMAQEKSPACTFGPVLMSGDDYALALAGGDGSGADGRASEGVVFGSADVPGVDSIFSVPADEEHISTWLLSPSWIVRNASAVVARTRDLSTAATVYDPTELSGGKLGTAVAGFDNALFVEITSEHPTALSVWMPESGRVALVTGEEFATDGTDMVWIQLGSEDGGATETRSLMTAPYSTDPTEVESSARVVADTTGNGHGRWEVGCGRAARVSFVGDDTSPSLTVVDLADGGLEVLSSVVAGAESLAWTKVVGLTCSHVYVLGSSSGQANLWKLTVAKEPPDAGLDAEPDADANSGIDAAPDVSLDVTPDVSLDATHEAEGG